MTSLSTAGCSMFLLRLPGKFCRQSYRAVSKMNAVVVDRGFEHQAVERQPGTPAPVHGLDALVH